MITPDAATDDGLLDVCVVGDVSRAEFLRTFPSVYRGEHVRNPQVTIRRGAHVTIESVDPWSHSSCGRAANGSARCPPRSPRCAPRCAS